MAGEIDRFRSARRDPALAVLEGFHALKHGLRFGAELTEVLTTDAEELERLAAELAPDLAGAFRGRTLVVAAETFAQLAPQAHRTGVIAIARRPALDLAAVLADRAPRPLVLLEDPRNMGNMGACVRVAAAADAAGVLTTGDNDPWHPDALRGAAGLHFALPVARVERWPPAHDDPSADDERPPAAGRPLLALDPDGDVLDPARLPARAILAFGTERDGLSDALLARADARIRIPMRAGVSSLNLATSVAAVLFARRL